MFDHPLESLNAEGNWWYLQREPFYHVKQAQTDWECIECNQAYGEQAKLRIEGH
jgi:hypothetical protein